MLVAERKKRTGGQDNKLVEIEKPRGFDRMLPVERILGVTDRNRNKTLMFLIKWVDCDEYDLLPVATVNEKAPQAVIAYYEQRSKIYQKAEQHALIHDALKKKLALHPPKTVNDSLEHKVKSKKAKLDTSNTDTASEEAENEPQNTTTTDEVQKQTGQIEQTENVATESVSDSNTEVEAPAEDEPTTIEPSDEPLPEDIQIPEPENLN